MIWVLTNPELGWSCVVAAYNDYNLALEAAAKYENFSYTELSQVQENLQNFNCTLQPVGLNKEFW